MPNRKLETKENSTRSRVAAMNRVGFSVRAIANATGVSTQRVYQLLNELGIDAPSKREDDEGGSTDAA